MKPIHILLVEDNEGDIILTKEALDEQIVSNKLSIIKNGSDAIDFMLKQGDFIEAETPDLVLLDVNLPLKNGHEVLHAVKTNDTTKHIPVIMFTTSSSNKDIVESYKNHANSYITKPVEIDKFLHAIEGINDYWIGLAKLPSWKAS